MNNFSLINYLKLNKKLHLLSFFSNLPDCEAIDQEILDLDLIALEEQAKLFEKKKPSNIPITPFRDWTCFGSKETEMLGRDLTEKGKVGCIIIAGGQGTRLGHSGPKGTFPISLVKKKSLFQIFSEKIIAASKLCQIDLPLAVMTSPLNQKETQHHFEKNGYFGLSSSQIDFFNQPTLPFVDFDQKLFKSDSEHLAIGPNGNGSVFEAFQNSGVAKKWHEKGIEYINIILVDNPLADPVDFELIGHLAYSENECCLKSCKRLNPEEKVGIIVQSQDRPIVIEYHEVPSTLTFSEEPCANLSMLAITFNFAQKMSQKSLPLHKVQKKAPYYDLTTGLVNNPSTPNAWKFEKYLFDILFYTQKTSVLLYPREDIFYPLKALDGKHSPKEVQNALMKKEQKILQNISRCSPPKTPFELSAEFYYPTKDFKEKWLNKMPHSPYLI